MVPTETFFSLLLSKKLTEITVQEFHDKLVQLVENVHEMKLFYTLLRASLVQGLLSRDRVTILLESALKRTAQTCSSESSLATYKVTLAKCFQDGLLDEHTFHILDNRAEVQRMSNADFILDMKATIDKNTHRIEGLEGTVKVLQDNIKILHDNVRLLDDNIKSVHQSLDKLKSGMRFKLKMEATMGMMGAVVNAVSLGIGGSLLQAFHSVVSNVIDYGDISHILKVIKSEANPQDATELESSFQQGIELGLDVLNDAAEVIAQKKLEEAVQQGDPIFVLGITATLINPQQELVLHGDLKEIYPDAVLSEGDEGSLELHAAVKFGDKESLEQLLSELDLSTELNAVDSDGRTATDLAALTGQTDLMNFLVQKGGKFAKKSRSRMKALANKRAPAVKDYLQLIQEELEE